MKKLLTFLWIIIITGVVLITIHNSKPKSDQLEENSSENTKIPRNQTAKDSQTKSSANYLQTADTFIEEDDYQNAIANYEKALIENQDSLEIMLKLGDAYLKNNQNEEARDLFIAAAKIEPDSIDINISLARAHLALRDIEQTKKIIWSLDAQNNKVKYYKAITLILYKDFTNAKNIFKEIAKAEPKPDQQLLDNIQKFLDAYENFSYYKESEQLFLQLLLAKALTNVQEYQAAIPLLYDIINAQNNYRDAWIVLGYSYLNINKVDEAIDALEQAKELTPEKPETLFFLGLSYFAKNDIDKAIYYVEKADKYGYEPKDQINLKLGDFYLLKENYKKSAHKYEAVLSKNTKNMDIFVRAVWLNIDHLDNAKKALTLSKLALEKHPNDAMSYNLVGWAQTALGNYNEAKQNLQMAMSLNANFDAANLNFGWLYEKAGDNLLAKEYYKKAYILGRGNSIGRLAASRYNELSLKVSRPKKQNR